MEAVLTDQRLCLLQDLVTTGMIALDPSRGMSRDRR